MTLARTFFDIAGPVAFSPRRVGDARGFVSETYNAGTLREIGIDCAFVQDNHTWSPLRGTVRGLHAQRPSHAQAKLIRVPRGRILDVFIDIRRGSPSYGRHGSVELSAENWRQLFLPHGFAHGFCTLEPDTEVLYKLSAHWIPQSETGIRWNDPALGIAWPDFAGASVSERDAALPLLADFASPFA